MIHPGNKHPFWLTPSHWPILVDSTKGYKKVPTQGFIVSAAPLWPAFVVGWAQ